jgi:recombination protein U
MSIDRRLIGKRNKINGATFETLISNSCKYYLGKNIAHIEKTPEPFHITGKGKNGVVSGYYEKVGQPDYKGILFGGKGIMFEAKHTDTDRINQNVVTENQAKNLDIYEKFGAICFVLVSIKFENFYRVPWNVWKSMKEKFKHKYMNEDELSPYKLNITTEAIFFLDDIENMNN